MADDDEDTADDGAGLYLFWRFVAWRRARGLPEVDLDLDANVTALVAELDELLDGVTVTRVSAP